MEINKIYFDMDGVLADFDRGVVELAHSTPFDQAIKNKELNDILWGAIKKVDHFYDKLEMVEGAYDMFMAIYEKYGDKCEILSAIPKPHREIFTAKEDKINWVHRLLGPDIKVNIVYRSEKKDFCRGADCILIDDLEQNVREWIENGGTGIRFADAKSTLEAFEALYKD